MKKKVNKYNSSIATRLVCYNSLVIISIFLLTFLVIMYLNYNLSLEKEKQTMEAYLVNSIKSVDNQIKDMARVSLIVYSDEKSQNIIRKWALSSQKDKVEYDTYLKNLFISMITIRNDIDGIYIFDRESMIFKYDTKGAYANSEFNLSEAKWITKINIENSKPRGYKLVIKEEYEFVNRNLKADPFENKFIAMIREIKSFSPNERIGHILLSSSVSSIKETLDKSLDAESYYVLLDEDNNIICEPSGKYLGDNLENKEPGLLEKILENEKSFSYKLKNENVFSKPTKNLVSYYVSEYSGLTLLILKPYNLILKDTYFIITILSVISIIAIIIMIVLLRFSTKKIVKPILMLSDAMTKFRKGEKNIKLPENSVDEVGKLTESFSKMMKEIKELIYTEYESKIKIQEAELKENEARLMYLKSQINPHFLYNTLDTIRIKAELNNDSDVADMIMELVDFFRSSINDDSQMVTIKNEIKLNKSYLALMKFRYPNLKSKITIEEGLENVEIPNFIIQPIIENSLVHGLKSVNYNGEIMVTIKRSKEKQGDIIIEVSDNGVGKAENIQNYIANKYIKKTDKNEDKVKHVGIANINQRLKMFFSDDYYIKYTNNKDGGVKATIKVSETVSSDSVYNETNR